MVGRAAAVLAVVSLVGCGGTEAEDPRIPCEVPFAPSTLTGDAVFLGGPTCPVCLVNPKTGGRGICVETCTRSEDCGTGMACGGSEGFDTAWLADLHEATRASYLAWPRLYCAPR